jgi:hypothetical protein
MRRWRFRQPACAAKTWTETSVHISARTVLTRRALNPLVKKVTRCGHGFQRFEHYRLRVLLHTGGID